MVQVTLNNQTAALVKNGSESIIKLDQISTVKLDVAPDQIQKIERVGNNAVITLKNGEVFTLDGFYDHVGSQVVLQDGASGWQVGGLESAQVGEVVVSYLPVEVAPVSTQGGGLIDFGSLAAGLAGVGVAVAVSQRDHDNKDTTPPAAGILSVDGFVDTGSSSQDLLSNDKTFSLVLTGHEIGTHVQFQLSIDGGKTWVNTTAAQTNVADGSYQYRAVVTDNAGNQSITNFKTVIVDTVAPVTGSLSLSNFADTGSSSTDGISQDKSFDLILTGLESGTVAKYQVSIDGGKTWVDTTVAQKDLADGSYQYRAVVTDAAGNQSISNIEKVVVDNTAPSSNYIFHTDVNDLTIYRELQSADVVSYSTQQNSFILNNNLIDTEVVYQVSTDNKTWVNTSAQQENLTDGLYYYRTVTSDVAGNEFTSTLLLITVDKDGSDKKTISLLDFEDNGANPSDQLTNDNNFELNVDAEEYSYSDEYVTESQSITYQVSSDNGVSWQDTNKSQNNLADGVYQYRAVITKDYTNIGFEPTYSYVTHEYVALDGFITIDQTAPVAGTLSLSNFADTGSASTDGISQDKNFDLTLTGQEAGTTVQYQRSTDGGNTWVNTTIDQTNVADGSYQYRAVVTDAAGNSLVSNVQEITIDTQLNTSAISLTINSITEDNIITLVESTDQHVITGSLAGLPADLAEYTLTVWVSGHSYAAVINPVTGQWTATVAGSDLFAATQIDTTLKLIDKAGNQAQVESVKSYTVNAVPDAPVDVLMTTNSMDGTIVSGSAFAGSVINIKDSSGNIVATTITNADGTFVIDLPMLLSDGEALTVTASVNEQESQVVESTVKEVPTVYIRSIDAEGVVNGVATPGSVISIVDNQGNLLQEFQVPQTIPLFAQLGIFEPSVSFTFTLSNPLAEGEQVFIHVTKNAVEGRPDSFVADYTPPAVATNVLINDDGSLITGHVTDTDTYISIIDANGYQVGFGEVDEQGNFAAELYQPLHDGQTVSVVVIDFNQNQSPAVDVIAPDYAPIPEVDRISAEGLITGHAEANSQITLTDANGQVLATGVTNPQGFFYIESGKSFVDGQQVFVSAINTKGQQSAQGEVVVDLIAPTAPTDLTINEQGTIVTGYAEPNSQVKISVNGGWFDNSNGYTNADGYFSVLLNRPLHDGQSINVSVLDDNGNISPVVTITAPEYAFPASVRPIGQDNVLNGTAENGSTIVVKDADGNEVATGEVYTNGGWWFPFDTGYGSFHIQLPDTLLDGQQLSVFVVDSKGNVSEPTITTVDHIAPTAPVNVELADDGTTLIGEAESYATVRVLDTNGYEVGFGQVNGSGQFEFKLYGYFLKGESLTVVTVDQAGNSSTSVAIVAPVDTTPPAAATELSIDQYGRVLTGVAEANSIIQVKNADGNVVGSTTTQVDGTFTVNFYGAYVRGETLNVQVTDRADNHSVSATIVAPIDTTAPTTPTDLVINATNGQLLTGKAEAYSHIVIKDAAGNQVGDSYTNEAGVFSAYLYNVYLKGQTLKVVATDAAGNISPAASVTASIDNTAPLAATDLAVSADGSYLSGVAEVGASIKVLDANGNQVSTGYSVVESGDGSFNLNLYGNIYLHGEVLTVVVIDRAGNTSPAVTVTAPLDNTAPVAATELVISADGSSLSGVAEAGATVRVLDADGNQVNYNYQTVNADGTFTVSFYDIYLKGQELTVQVVDRAGNLSPAVTVTAPLDNTAPLAATDLLISDDGSHLSGFAEAGATIKVLSADGNQLNYSNETVGSDGTFNISFYWDIFLKGEVLTVQVIDRAGNASSTTTVTAPLDNTAPLEATELVISADGSYLSGAAEAGATIKVLNADGNQLNYSNEIVGSDGTFNISFYWDIFLKGEVLTVQVIDRAGNTSPTVTVTAPLDNTAPLAATDLEISANGSQLFGVAEAGATIRVIDADGNQLNYFNGEVSFEGTFNVAFYNNIFLKGEVLTVVVVDRAGNVSPSVTVTAPLDNTSPLAATDLVISADGSQLSGVAEAGSTIKVFNAEGSEVYTGGTVVSVDGTFNAQFYWDIFLKGESLTIQVVDRAGNIGPSTVVVAPIDNTAPLAATNLAFDEYGYLTGQAEADTTVIVKTASGQTLGSTTVYDLVDFSIYNNFELQQGEEVFVTVVDRAGNESPTMSITVPVDPNAPASATDLLINEAGNILTGQAEADSYIYVYNTQGQFAAYSTQTDSAGHFTVQLTQFYVKGETLSVFVSVNDQYSIASKVIAPVDTTAPLEASYIWISDDGGYLTGIAESMSQIIVKNASGEILNTSTVIVDSNGQFSVWFNPPLEQGQEISITAIDVAGNESTALNMVVTPDVTPPEAATSLSFGAEGNSLNGQAEPLSLVEVYDQIGNYITSGYTNTQGVFDIYFYTYYLHNEVLSVRVIDASGNVSPSVTVTAPLDDVAPLAATDLVVSEDGSYLSGTAEAGTTIKVFNAAGDQIYTNGAITSTDGTFTANFYWDIFLKGEVLTVQVVDHAGNTSPSVTVTAPLDNTPPEVATNLVISENGSYLSGVAEAGATIRVWDISGNPVSILYETVNSDGSFNVWFYNNIFLKGESFTVEVIDRAGNISPVASVTAPLDNTAPLAATALAVSTDGSHLSGVAEAEATIKVLDTDGNQVNSPYDTVYSDGTFSTPLNNVYLKGQELTVIIVDRAGNESPVANVTAPLDDIAPLAATNMIFNENGYLIGDAEVDSTVIIKSVDGQQVAFTTVYGADGFTIYNNFVLMQGQELFVTVVDRAGNLSPAVSIIIPIDPNAPALATNLVISDDGLYLSGQANSGNYVHVYSENGDAISTYNWVDSTGTFNIPLYNHYLRGETLKVYVSDSYSYSLASEVTAPLDNIAPDPVTNLSISDDGYWLTGLAEANTTILIYNQQGNVAGEGTTDSAGNINIPVWNNFVAGEVLNVVAVDFAGNFSSATAITVPDTSTTWLVTHPSTVPEPTDLMINYDGAYLSGKSEPGTYINVYKDDGSPVSLSNLVNDTGTFTIPLSNYSNGTLLFVTASDAQGNASISSAVTTPFDDTTQNTTDPLPAPVENSAMLADTDTSAVANGFGSSATTGSILNLADQAGLVFVANTGDQPIKPMQLDSLLVDSTNSGGVVIQIHSTGDQLTITSGDNIQIDSTAAVSNSVDQSSLASVPLSANSIDLLLNPTQLYL